MRDLHLLIQRKHIHRKAIALIRPTHPTFKASVGWLAKFLTRHSLHDAAPSKLSSSRSCWRSWKQSSGGSTNSHPRLSSTWMKHWFVWHGFNTTVDRQGKKEVIIRGTGAHKCHFTVTLICTASGQMPQPFVAFKEKTEHILKKIKVKENEGVITPQANECMDYKLMMCWICKVLMKYTKGRHALLAFDIFEGAFEGGSPCQADWKQYFLCDNSRWLHEQNPRQIHGHLLEQVFQDLPTYMELGRCIWWIR